MRAIDADALTSKIQKQYCEDCNRRKGENNGKRYMVYEIGDAPCRACGIDDMYAELDDAPTIQPEPHTGHWVPVGMAEAVGGESAMWGRAVAYHVCSECWEQALEENGEEKLSDFCPHCGAKMEGTT